MTTREALRDSSNLHSPYAKALLSRPKPQRSKPRRQSCLPLTKPATDEEDEEEDAYFSADECPSTPAAAAPENLYDNLEPSAAPVVPVNQQLLSELSGVLGARRNGMSLAKPTESPARRSSTAPGAQASILANAAAEMVAQRAKKKEAAAEKARVAEAAEAERAQAVAMETALEAEAARAAEVEATQAAEAEAAQATEAEAKHARALAEVVAESERARLEAGAKMRQLEEAQLAAEAKAEALKAAAAQHLSLIHI